MNTKLTITLFLALIFVAFAASAIWYPQLPEQMASHWNTSGEVDGFMPKLYGAFLMPVIGVLLFLLFFFLPKLDPLQKNLESFRPYYNKMFVAILIFLFYIHTLSLWWNVAGAFDMSGMIIPAVGFLFLCLGHTLGASKRNWFVGIRTPWTLSSDTVWSKTHQLARTLFYIAGSTTLIGFFWREAAFVLLLVPVLIAAFVPMIASYFFYQNEQPHRK